MRKKEVEDIAKKLIAQKIAMQYSNFMWDEIVNDGEVITGKITKKEKEKIFKEVGNQIDILYKNVFFGEE